MHRFPSSSRCNLNAPDLNQLVSPSSAPCTEIAGIVFFAGDFRRLQHRILPLGNRANQFHLTLHPVNPELSVASLKTQTVSPEDLTVALNRFAATGDGSVGRRRG
ncbi:hypothetical protein U1Q18_013873 [Sarracenia purpurea var. burkii]